MGERLCHIDHDVSCDGPTVCCSRHKVPLTMSVIGRLTPPHVHRLHGGHQLGRKDADEKVIFNFFFFFF